MGLFLALRRGAVAASLIAGTAGCGLLTSPDEGVVLEIGRQTYALGDTLTATLRNESNEPASYNFCFAIMDRRDGVDWKPTGSLLSSNGVCSAIAIGLPAHSEAKLEAKLRPEFTAGSYRLRMSVDRQEVATRAFEVVD